jgi:hypothetical protein
MVLRKQGNGTATPGIYRLLFPQHYSLHLLTLDTLYVLLIALLTPLLLCSHAALASAQMLTFEPVTRTIHQVIGIPGTFSSGVLGEAACSTMSPGC